MEDPPEQETVKNPRVQQRWHRDCDLKFSHTSKDGVRAYWCDYHGQWTYEFPVSKKFIYADGSSYETTSA